MSIAAILLAAGQSRRMGAFKPLLPFGEVTVAECCATFLLKGGADRVVVVTGHRGEEVRRALSHLPVSFAVNPEAQSEMGESIARGVEELEDETEALLIALVDQPAVPAAVPQALIREWHRTQARLLVPEHAGRGGHPVLLDGCLREELINLDRQRGLRSLFDRHRGEVLRLRVESPYIARDMDTWDDYRALYREVFKTEPKAGDSPAA
jgi:molybdenum cofactor cytidylyltransferase